MENSGHKKGWERFALSAEVCCFTSALLDISSCVDKVSAQPSTKFRPTIAGRPQVGTVIKIVFIRRGPHTVRGHLISSSPPSNLPIAPLPPRSLQLQCLYDCWCGRHGHKELPGEQLDVNCHHQPRDGAVLVSAWVCRNYTLPIHHTLELSTHLHEISQGCSTNLC